MKKTLALLLTLLLALSACAALADQYPGERPWTLYMIDNGTVSDFDGNDEEETYTLATSLDEYGDGSFTITVDGQSFTQENCCMLADEVYIIPIGRVDDEGGESYIYGTLFMVSEYGPSDDPLTYCYLYTAGQLFDVGVIPSLPDDMTLDGKVGMITTSVRADMIGTWHRPADYILAWGVKWSDDYESAETYNHLVEVPRPVYPMGMIVTLRQELPLMASQTDRVFSANLAAGQQVILAATDDVRWLYVTSMDGLTRGWVRMSSVDWEQKITVGDRDVPVNDVFDGIVYAD